MQVPMKETVHLKYDCTAKVNERIYLPAGISTHIIVPQTRKAQSHQPSTLIMAEATHCLRAYSIPEHSQHTPSGHHMLHSVIPTWGYVSPSFCLQGTYLAHRFTKVKRNSKNVFRVKIQISVSVSLSFLWA